jgi:benzoyl-CoA reductase/2-hydroxyglutaryl-CoA dehydratase subunit BcrC/BadD/HgdB
MPPMGQTDTERRTRNAARGPSRREYLRQQREQHGRRAVAALPVEHPREIATALGRITVELWGPPGVASTQSQAWLPSFACPLARNALEWILRGEVAAVAELLVVPHTCDSLQALASQVIDLGAGSVPAVTFYHPRTLDPAARAAFVRDELGRFRAAVEDRLGPIAEDALAEAISLHREADVLARRLLDEGPREGLSESARYADLRRREWCWVGDQIAALRAALEHPRLPREALGERVPILLSGIVPEPPGLLEALEAAGLWIADDDTAALGRRLPEHLPPATGEPLEDLALRYEALPPCSTRTGDLDVRVAWVVRRALDAGVRGALFVQISRCEPELFDQPELRAALRATGVVSAVVETELEASLPASLLTRIEAFGESVRGGGGR